MVMSEHSTVVGVFTDDLYADLAADELRKVGFSDDEISVCKHKEESGGLKNGLKRLFKGQETTPVATANDFMRMGVPEQDAQYYQSELDAGRAIVLVLVAGQEHEVLEILRKHGAMTSRRPNMRMQAEPDYAPVAQDTYSPIANRDSSNPMVPPEDLR